VAATIMGINPKSVEHIILAEEEGLGKTHSIIKGADMSYFKAKYPKIGFSEKLMALGYKIISTLGLNKHLA